MSLTALALVVSTLAVGGAIAFLVVRALELWRALRGFSRALGEEVARAADSLERLAAFEPPDTERLTTAVERLRLSQERLTILTNAVGRVRGQWAALLVLAPKKQ